MEAEEVVEICWLGCASGPTRTVGMRFLPWPAGSSTSTLVWDHTFTVALKLRDPCTAGDVAGAVSHTVPLRPKLEPEMVATMTVPELSNADESALVVEMAVTTGAS